MLWLPENRLSPREPVVAFPGPFTRAMAEAGGLSDFALATWVEERRLVRPLHGVYVDATVDLTLPVRAEAISLVAPPESVIVDRTAAWLHGIDVLRRSSVHEAPPVEMYLRKDSRIRRDGIDSGRRSLLSRDVVELHGVQVTTPARTCLDLGRSMWRFDALGAIDQFVRSGVSLDELVRETARFRGFRGVRQLRVLLPLADPRAESMPESALRLHWYDALLPDPHPQFWVYDVDGTGLFRLDLADPNPQVRYCAEFDGEENHTSGEDREHDARRRAWCRREQGWDFDVFTKSTLYGPRANPADVLAAGWLRARDARRR